MKSASRAESGGKIGRGVPNGYVESYFSEHFGSGSALHGF